MTTDPENSGQPDAPSALDFDALHRQAVEVYDAKVRAVQDVEAKQAEARAAKTAADAAHIDRMHALAAEHKTAVAERNEAQAAVARLAPRKARTRRSTEQAASPTPERTPIPPVADSAYGEPF